MGYLRLAARLFGVVILLLGCLLAHALWRLLRRSSPWPRIFLKFAAWTFGARAQPIGACVRRNVVFLSNHLSWIDILAVAGATGCAFVAKSEIKRAPVVGWLADLNGTIYVDRADRGDVVGQIDRLRAALIETRSVAMFPEGTTNDGTALLPFKSALLKIFEPPSPGLCVQPVLIDYGPVLGPDIAWTGTESGHANALRVIARPGSFAVRIHFLEPLDPAEYQGRKAIAAETRARIESAMARARER